MKKFMCLVMAAVMVMAMAACGSKSSDNSGSSAAGTFRFGASGPLTGDAAIYGKAVMNAAQIAVDEINAKGGFQIEFNPQDDEADGEKAVNAYNNLLDWGMQVMVGPVTTGSAIATSAVAYQERTFCLTPSASSADVTAGKDNMYQVCFTDPNQGTGSADYIAENLAGHKIAVIYRNDDAYSQGIRDTFAKEAAAKGLEVVYEGTFTKDTQTDFSVQVAAAKDAGADLVFLPIYYTPASLILATAKSMDYAPVFFGVDGMDGILTMEGFDASLAEGVFMLTPFSADAQDERTQSFVASYKELTGEIPNQFAADCYDAVWALWNASLSAGIDGSTSPEDACELLIEQFTGDFEAIGLTGTMTWDETGAVTKTPTAVVIQDGAYVGFNG